MVLWLARSIGTQTDRHPVTFKWWLQYNKYVLLLPDFDHCLFMFFNKQIIPGKSSTPDNFGIFTSAVLAAAAHKVLRFITASSISLNSLNSGS